MKNLILTLVMASFAISVTQAQVKRQYRDQSQLETTVVVKHNDADATDIDILNSQFNMADVGMGDVIMITTERDRPQTQISAPAATVVETIAETPISTTTTQAEVVIPTTEQTVEASDNAEAIPAQEVTVEVVVPQELLNVPTAQRQTSERTVSRSSNSAASLAKKAAAKKAYKKSKRGKRVNLKNRKKPSKRKKLRCYAF